MAEEAASAFAQRGPPRARRRVEAVVPVLVERPAPVRRLHGVLKSVMQQAGGRAGHVARVQHGDAIDAVPHAVLRGGEDVAVHLGDPGLVALVRREHVSRELPRLRAASDMDDLRPPRHTIPARHNKNTT